MSGQEAYFVTRTMRALELLTLQPLSAPQVAAALQIHPRTARRTLERLRDEGYLERGDNYRRPYAPTLRLLALAGQLVDRLRLVEHAMPVVQQLQELTGGVVHLAIPSYRSALCIVHAAPGAPVRREIGELMPCHCTATGKVLLAYRQPWRDSVLRSRLAAPTTRTQTDAGRLRAELDRVRRMGYATERGELRDDEYGVAAPVRRWGDDVNPALGVSVHESLDVVPLAEVAIAAADRLGRTLDGRERGGPSAASARSPIGALK